MGPYSHFILAARLEKQLMPNLPNSYYWGAIVPDVRYLAHMRREQTHLDKEQIQRFADCYPHLASFLLGYRVHCIIDQFDLDLFINTNYPFKLFNLLLRKRLSHQQITMLVEMYFLKTPVESAQIAGEHNEVLNDLQVPPEQTRIFFEAMQTYIQLHTVDAAMSAYQSVMMIDNSRMEKYLKAFSSMQNHRLLNVLLMAGIKNSHLEEKVIQHVQAANHQ